ncbi:hypothetical protein [Chryseobacterium sp.]|uniref:hypothetical protein n=1 Tax=Chryseobacterium sp. TaxID=1871047 RepID=UPI0024E254D8|nr:hypothetical protein [Chryseobacterium sp.]
MKTTYNKYLLIILITMFFSCKAQQILPLNTLMENIPQNAYVKDLSNELVPYIGTYKANYQGNEITLFITKEENKLTKRAGKQFYRDVLNTKFIVKGSSNTILQDTKNNNLQTNTIYSTKIRSYDNSIILYYNGTNCSVGWGNIFIKKISNTQFSWDYRPDDMIITPGKCPGNPDLTIYLPVTKGLIFTKQ